MTENDLVPEGGAAAPADAPAQRRFRRRLMQEVRFMLYSRFGWGLRQCKRALPMRQRRGGSGAPLGRRCVSMRKHTNITARCTHTG